MDTIHMSNSTETFIKTRSLLASNVEYFLEHVSRLRESKKIDSDDLFGGGSTSEVSHTLQLNTTLPMKTKLQVLLEEKESLGLYISGSPLEEYKDLTHTIQDTILRDDLHLILINKIRKIFTKKNLMMFAMSISTINGDFEGIIFPKKAMQFSPILQEKELFWVKAKLSEKKKEEVILEEGETREYDEIPKMLIDAIVPFESGVLEVFKDEKITISSKRQEILASYDWGQLKYNPNLDTTIDTIKINEAETSISTRDLSRQLPQEIQTIKLSRKLGTEMLKYIKSHLKKEKAEHLIEVIIEVEGVDGWKKAKGNYWIENIYFNEVVNVLTKK
jgi:DNA polymerase III alpha subunit